MEGEAPSSGLYRPRIEAERQTSEETVRATGAGQCAAVQDVDDSQLVGVPVAVAGDTAVSCVRAPAPMVMEVKATVTTVIAVEKRKRGRPPRGSAPKPPPPKRKKEEEDVCFICFDGGSLVLCDRKGCPKAYHPACIKRDEAFFRSKAKWNCGWHICSICQKAAHYMCYTCTYSLCKGCTKDADYVCVRGNYGFCVTCMRTIMLIENKDGNNEMVQVDFDDKSSWEYLFKVYWIYLKEKLSLTIHELLHAESPWKEASTIHYHKQSPNFYCVPSVSKGQISGRSSEHLALQKPKEPLESLDKNLLNTGHPSVARSFEHTEIKQPDEQQELPNKDCVQVEMPSFVKGSYLNGCIEWASKELLEFVGHMKNGDTSVLSQFDVQALLLDYIKRNNLRDPRRKSQIICDLRLKNLFGKPRVGHIEMLKLLEYHFLIKEDSQNKAFIPAGIVGTFASHVEADVNNCNQLTRNKNKRRKSSKIEEREPQTNLNDYAAINVHNINLIYLRRNLMENLLADKEKFHDKVIGSIVRIRISSSDQKQDIYRLVQVVGTSSVALPYKIGELTLDIMLEILNLDKKEAISIDAISNQDFSEDECGRLRQSVKCGLVKALTVGEIQKKAMELQEVRVNDLLEAEILRLNHLCDRANEKGRKKELRECVEKLQLLKTPEERQRRLLEIPLVHADPKMDPKCESDNEAGGFGNEKQEEHAESRFSRFTRNRGKAILPISGKRKVKEGDSIGFHPRKNEIQDACGSNSLERQENWANNNGSITDHTIARSESDTTTLPFYTGNQMLGNNSETDKLWYYLDPNGKIQGPFSMMQLSRWNTTGLFPPDMRIWRDNEHDDSILLTEALTGQFHKTLQPLSNRSSQSLQLGVSDNRPRNYEIGWSENTNGTGRDSKQAEDFWHHNETRVDQNVNNGFAREDGLPSPSLQEHKDSLEDNDATNKQVGSLLPSSSLGQIYVNSPHQGEGHESKGFNTGPFHGNLDLLGAACQIAEGNDNENQFNSHGQHGQLSGQNWRSLPVSLGSNNVESNSGLASEATPPEPNDETDAPELPSPTPKISVDEAPKKQKHNFSLNDPVQDPDIADLPSPTPKPRNEDQGAEISQPKQVLPSKFPAQESGPSWSSASSLVIGGSRLAEIADDWGGYSPTNRHSVEEWDSGLVSVSSLKPHEPTGDHVATPTSNGDQINHSSPSHPASNVSAWHAVVNEPIEFSTLAEESVSDLLAEVDAMESQSGLPSPTSAIKCGEDLIQGCRNDCFSSIEELSPTPDPVKSDALSSTGDMQLPCQSTVTDEPVMGSQADAFDSLKRSDGQSSTSSEGETKSADIPLNRGEAGSDIHLATTHSMNQDTIFRTTGRSTEFECMDPGWGTVQANMNLGRGGSTQGIPNVGWGTSGGIPWTNPNVNRGALSGGSVCDNQRKYGGERFGGPRDWAMQGGDSGFARNRPSWGRQPSGGGGGYSRPLPRGQRVCKFYESGRCKKGASCDYLHP